MFVRRTSSYLEVCSGLTAMVILLCLSYPGRLERGCCEGGSDRRDTGSRLDTSERFLTTCCSHQHHQTCTYVGEWRWVTSVKSAWSPQHRLIHLMLHQPTGILIEIPAPRPKLPAPVTPAPHLRSGASLDGFPTWVGFLPDCRTIYIMLTGVNQLFTAEQRHRCTHN